MNLDPAWIRIEQTLWIRIRIRIQSIRIHITAKKNRLYSLANTVKWFGSDIYNSNYQSVAYIRREILLLCLYVSA